LIKIFLEIVWNLIFLLDIYINKQAHKTKSTMITLTNTKGTKEVVITKDGAGTIHAMYCLIRPGEWCSQVLQAKVFASVKNAEKWANKILN
jgi:hypothetical protein